MITGARLVLFSTDPEADRVFLRDTLGLTAGFDGDGGPSFALPMVDIDIAVQAESAAPDDSADCRFCLTVDDLHATLARLAAHGIASMPPTSQVGEGTLARIPLPGGGVVELLERRRHGADNSGPGSRKGGRADGGSAGRPGNRFATDRDSDPA